MKVFAKYHKLYAARVITGGTMTAKENYLVYVVDDDPLFIEQVKQYLHRSTSAFLRVRSFASPEECMQHTFQKPDIIFLEHAAAKEDTAAVQVLKKIKSSFQEIPVVILTRNQDLGIVVKCMRSGAYSYIIKNREAFDHIGKMLNKMVQRIRMRRMEKAQQRKKILLWSGLLVLILVIFLFFYAL